MFFGKRLNSDNRLLPFCTTGTPLISRKHTNSSKSWPVLLPITPTLVKPSHLSQFKVLEKFISAHTPVLAELGVIDVSPDAFRTLVGCLIGSFHRHEHFQVRGLPALLPSMVTTRLVSLWDAPVPPSNTPDSSPAEALPPGCLVCTEKPNAQHSLITTPATATDSHTRNGSKNLVSSTMRLLQRTRNHHRNPVTETTTTPNADSAPGCPEATHSTTCTPQPPSICSSPVTGVVFLDLHRLSEEDLSSSSVDNNSNNNKRSSNACSNKSGRKSPNHPLYTGDVSFMLPTRFSIQITGLATPQVRSPYPV